MTTFKSGALRRTVLAGLTALSVGATVAATTDVAQARGFGGGAFFHGGGFRGGFGGLRGGRFAGFRGGRLGYGIGAAALGLGLGYGLTSGYGDDCGYGYPYGSYGGACGYGPYAY